MSQIDKKLALLSHGNLATIALDKFASEVEAQKENLLSSAKAGFRAGTLSHDSMVGLLASLVALDNVVSSLQRQVRTANSVRAKELESGHPEPTN